MHAAGRGATDIDDLATLGENHLHLRAAMVFCSPSRAARSRDCTRVLVMSTSNSWPGATCAKGSSPKAAIARRTQREIVTASLLMIASIVP